MSCWASWTAAASPATPAVLDRYLKNGYNTTVVEYLGRGHEHFLDEQLPLFDWMNRCKRSFPLPREREGTHEREFDCKTMRLSDNFFWWAEIESLPPNSIVTGWTTAHEAKPFVTGSGLPHRHECRRAGGHAASPRHAAAAGAGQRAEPTTPWSSRRAIRGPRSGCRRRWSTSRPASTSGRRPPAQRGAGDDQAQRRDDARRPPLPRRPPAPVLGEGGSTSSTVEARSASEDWSTNVAGQPSIARASGYDG